MGKDLNEANGQYGKDGAKKNAFDQLAKGAMANRDRRLNGNGSGGPNQNHTKGNSNGSAYPGSNLGDWRFDENKIVQQPRYIIKNLIPKEGTGLAGGKSGAGKSFVMVDMAVATASGEDFCSRQVREKLGVVILAAEGGGGIENRIVAAKRHRGLTSALPISFSSKINNLGNDDELDQLIMNLRQINRIFLDKFKVPIGLIIVDTMSKAFMMKDENSNAEIPKYCKRLEKISDEIGAFVLGVHHFGKNDDAELRGGSAWRASVDIVLGVLGDRDNKTAVVTGRSLVLAKSRDGTEGPISDFKLKFIELGTDDYGDPFGSCAIEPTGISPSRVIPKKPNGAHETFHRAFNEAIIASGQPYYPMGDGPKVNAVNIERVRDAFYGWYPAGDVDDQKTALNKKRAAFNRALTELVNGHPYHTENRDGIAWIWR